MTWEQLAGELAEPANTKMVLVVLDGLGGIPIPEMGGRTELEAARTPYLDALARRSELGLAHPVDYGITPGSSAGHLALFGYDPLRYVIGRGVLEALGIGFELLPGDVAARANFATVRTDGDRLLVTDRRAGRPSTEHSRAACERLQEGISEIEGREVIIRPVKEHRFVVVFRGEGLGDRVGDTDPQKEGLEPLTPAALDEESRLTANLAERFLERAREILAGEPQTNYALLRGFSKRPDIPGFPGLHRLRAAAIAVYPMYRGLASLVGMDLLQPGGEGIADELSALEANWGSYDYFFLHIKPTDSRGEDGDYQGKIAVIEEFDGVLPRILALKPDVLVITGDHSTPAVLRSHSWHPVPFLLHSRWVLPDADAQGFSEPSCARGSLGTFPAVKVMALMMAHAGRLGKFSA